jgi:hypothetical protein
MVHFTKCSLLLCLVVSLHAQSLPVSPARIPIPAPTTERNVVSLDPADLREFAEQPGGARKIIQLALELTRLNLKYQYGSANPSSGGLDCSGAVYYVLNQVGLTGVPRQANQMYVWVRKSGVFRAVWSSEVKTFELDELRPGDLLFWTGTYEVERDPPITHVMIYLGTEKATGRRVMVGASEGRRYGGVSRSGYSVFEFALAGYPVPAWAKGQTGRFIGYGKIPGVETLNLPEPILTATPTPTGIVPLTPSPIPEATGAEEKPGR